MVHGTMIEIRHEQFTVRDALDRFTVHASYPANGTQEGRQQGKFITADGITLHDIYWCGLLVTLDGESDPFGARIRETIASVLNWAPSCPGFTEDQPPICPP